MLSPNTELSGAGVKFSNPYYSLILPKKLSYKFLGNLFCQELTLTDEFFFFSFFFTIMTRNTGLLIVSLENK